MSEIERDRATRSQTRDVTIADVSFDHANERLDDDNRIEKLSENSNTSESSNADDTHILLNRDRIQLAEDDDRR